MLFLNIATGVILVLLGMRYVRKGLDRLFGSQLVDWLQQMTNNRYQAFFGGMVAGLIAPSSSAIAMLSVQMLNQTALTAGRMLLGIGLVFLAMGIIASAGTAAAANADLKLLFGVGDHYPLVVFMGTALLDEIKLMLRTVWMMIWGKNVRLVSKVEEHQRHIEGTQEELKDYLSQISDENLSEEDVDWKFIILDYSQVQVDFSRTQDGTYDVTVWSGERQLEKVTRVDVQAGKATQRGESYRTGPITVYCPVVAILLSLVAMRHLPAKLVT
jgi:Na+/phosphate symporter